MSQLQHIELQSFFGDIENEISPPSLCPDWQLCLELFSLFPKRFRIFNSVVPIFVPLVKILSYENVLESLEDGSLDLDEAVVALQGFATKFYEELCILGLFKISVLF